MGDIGTFSFDFAKTITTGEGGMLLLKKKNIFKSKSLARPRVMKIIPKFQDGRIQENLVDLIARMTELQGAVGISQLKNLIIFKKHKNKKYYFKKSKKFKEIQIRDICQIISIDASESLIFSL